MEDAALASSNVLRERLQWGLWKARHLPGSDGDGAEPKCSSRSGPATAIAIATVGGLVGLAAWEPTSSVGKIARLLAITALVAHLALTHSDPRQTCGKWLPKGRLSKKDA